MSQKFEDDAVGTFIGDYDEHMKFLDWCEFFKGYDPDVCFSNVRSWEDPEIHARAWGLFRDWQEWCGGSQRCERNDGGGDE